MLQSIHASMIKEMKSYKSVRHHIYVQGKLRFNQEIRERIHPHGATLVFDNSSMTCTSVTVGTRGSAGDSVTLATETLATDC